jgi:hypothetical protein
MGNWRRIVAALGVFANCLPHSTNGAQLHLYTIEEQWPPDDCFGGESCNFQPMVTIYDDTTAAIAVGFQGDVYAEVLESPTGFERLRINNGIVPATAVETAVEVYGGMARFKTLGLQEAGAYRLQYYARRRSRAGQLVDVATAEGASFTVRPGAPFELTFSVHPGSATGGLPLRPQPVLHIVDRGGNRLPSVGDDGSLVVARLAKPAGRKAGNATTAAAHPKHAAANFDPTEVYLRGTTTVRVVAGAATFTDLYINEVCVLRTSLESNRLFNFFHPLLLLASGAPFF